MSFLTKIYKEAAASNAVMYVFIGSSALSFFYTLVYQKYNGDFLGSQAYMGSYLLVMNVLLALVPFPILWKLYSWFKLRQPNFAKPHWYGLFVGLTFTMLIWNIFITYFYGVGVASAEVFDAPIAMKVIIQITIRFNIFWAVYLLVLMTPKKSVLDILIILLVITLSLMRSSIGVFLFIPMILTVKYYDEFLRFYRKNRLLSGFLIGLTLISIHPLYDARSTLRGSDVEEMSSGEFLLGRLAGRLSSFSNSAVIIENTPFFFIQTLKFDDLFLQKQVLSGFLTSSFLPDNVPEVELFKLNNPGDDLIAASYMAGINGVLYLSLFKSIYVLIINVFTYLMLMLAIMWVGSTLRVRGALEMTFIVMLYLVTSGVGNELGAALLSLLIFSFIFNVFHRLRFVKTSSQTQVD